MEESDMHRYKTVTVGLMFFSALLIYVPFLYTDMDTNTDNDNRNTPTEKPPVSLQWGVPDEVEMVTFAGLERSPQAEKFKEKDPEDFLHAVWEKGSSYIIPLFAYSEHTLKGVRYYGEHIPQSFDLEWLDPWDREWYPLDEIPGHMIRMIKETRNGHFTINFGPPEGAAFSTEKVRFIWFRVTPKKTGSFEISLFGFLPTDDNGMKEVSNRLYLQADVTH